VAETGRFVLDDSIHEGVVHRVEFRHTYVQPVVVAYIATRNGGDSYEVRVKDVTSSRCDVFGVEPKGGGHSSETVVYLVIEAGSHHLDSGGYVMAGTVSTSSVHRDYGDFGGEHVNLAGFNDTPTVLHTMNTYNNEAFCTSVASSVSEDGFDVQQEAAGTGVGVTSEVIGWVAFQAGSFKRYKAANGKDGSNDGLPDSPHVIHFQQYFTSSPDILVKSQSNSGDGES